MWLLIVLFYSSYCLLLKTLSNENINVFDLITDIFRSFTDKSTELIPTLINLRLTQNISPRKHITLVILIGIWLTISTVLTKSFSSLLLETYFNPKTYFRVNSIQEVKENTDLSVAGNSALFFLNGTKPEEYLSLASRACTYEKKWFGKCLKYEWRPLTTNEDILYEVVSGETVLFLESYGSEVTQRHNPSLRLVTAPDKYSPNYITIFVPKKHTKYTEILLT